MGILACTNEGACRQAVGGGLDSFAFWLTVRLRLYGSSVVCAVAVTTKVSANQHELMMMIWPFSKAKLHWKPTGIEFHVQSISSIGITQIDSSRNGVSIQLQQAVSDQTRD